MQAIACRTGTGADAWRVYDANYNQKAMGTGSGSATLPGTGAAAWLILLGAPGIVVNLNLVP